MGISFPSKLAIISGLSILVQCACASASSFLWRGVSIAHQKALPQMSIAALILTTISSSISMPSDTIFHIVVCNFSIITEGPTPFDDEVVTTGAPNPLTGTCGSSFVLAEEPIFPQCTDVGRDTDVANARANGIEVDEEEDPAPENAVEQPLVAGQVGEWVPQTVCPCRALDVANLSGRWRTKSWQVNAILDEFAVFCLIFPENYILKTIIPVTNEEIRGRESTLSEFYTWLGCHFFIACYVTEFDEHDGQRS